MAAIGRFSAGWVLFATTLAWAQASLTFDEIEIVKSTADTGATLTHRLAGDILEYELTTVTTTIGQRKGTGTFRIQRSFNQWFDRDTYIAFAPPAPFTVEQTVKDISSTSVVVFREEAPNCTSSFLRFNCDIGRMSLAPPKAGKPRRPYIDVELRASIVAGVTLMLRVYWRIDILEPCSAITFNHLEVVQAVQREDPRERLPLITGKPAVARMFLRFANPDSPQRPLAGVTGTLRAYREDVELVGSPLSSFTGTMTVEDPIQRVDLGHSLNFELPAGWLQSGDLLLEAEAILPPCADRTAPLRITHRETVTFGEARPEGRSALRLAWIPYCYLDPSFQPRPVCARPGDVPGYLELVRKTYPIAPDNLEFSRLPVPVRVLDAPLTNSDETQDFLTAMIKQDFAAEGRFHDHLIAVMPTFVLSTPGTKVLNGQVDDIPGRALVLWQNSDPGTILAHELAHIFGRKHVQDKVCTGSILGLPDGSSALFPDWPYDTADTQEVGFDVERRATTRPNLGDITSYCNNQNVDLWVSPFTYRKLVESRLTGSVQPYEAKTPRVRSGQRMAGAGAYAIISGTINQDGGGSLDPVYQVASGRGAAVSDPEGSHCLSFFAADDTAAGEHCFTPSLRDPESLDPLQRRRFVYKLPWPADTARLALTTGGRTLADLKTGPAPEVKITSPAEGEQWNGESRDVIWEATGPSGSPLVYGVLYSPDGGGVWHPLAMDLRETRLTVDPATIQGGPDIRFRVIATAGLNSTTADSGAIAVVQRPIIAADTSVVDFEDQRTTTAVYRSFTLSNRGSGPLTVSAYSVDNRDFEVVSPAAPFLIPAGEDASVRLLWHVDETGSRNGILTIASNDEEQPEIQVALSGSATLEGIPKLAVEPLLIDFGEVAEGESKEEELVIRNAGSAALEIRSVESGDPRFELTDDFSPVTIATGSSRKLAIRFAPGPSGSAAGKLTLRSSDPRRAEIEVPLIGFGTGSSPPKLVLTPGGPVGFGTLPPGRSVELDVFIGNEGGKALNVDSIAVVPESQFSLVRPPSTPFRVTSTAQKLTLRFSPAAEGVHHGTLTITSDDPASPTVVDLAGNGVVPNAAAPLQFLVKEIDSGGRLNFLSVNLGQSAEVALTVRNAGTGELTVTSVNSSNPAFATIPSPLSAFTLAPGGSRTVSIRYTPMSEGLEQSAMTFAVAGGGTAILNLSGTGVAVPAMVVTPTAIDFGPVTTGQSKEATVVIANRGPGALTVQLITNSGGPFSVINPPATPFRVGDAALSIVIRFAPASVGAVTGTLTIRGNDPASPTVSVNLTGSGIATPGGGQITQLSVDDGSYETSAGFPTGTVTAYFLNRLRPSTYPATLRSIQIAFSDQPGSLTTGTPITLIAASNPSGNPDINHLALGRAASRVVAQGQFNTYDLSPLTIGSGDFVVGFAVANPPNVFPAALDTSSGSKGRSYLSTDGSIFLLTDNFPPIAGNFGIRATVEVPSGAGGQAAILVSPASLDFGSVPAGQSRTLTLTLQNTGGAPLIVQSAVVSNGLFALLSPVPYVAGPGTSVALSIRFTPTAAGPQAATVTFTTNDPARRVVIVSMSGTGSSGFR